MSLAYPPRMLSPRVVRAVTVVVALASTAARARADVAPPEHWEATLFYPAPQAVDVPTNFALYVSSATAVSVADQETGEVSRAMADNEFGARWLLAGALAPGRYFVLAVPEPGADNFVGDGIPVDLGAFTVGRTLDSDAPTASTDQAIWDADNYTVVLSQLDPRTDEPVRFEIDVGDAHTAPDGTPDDTTSWNSTISSGLIGSWSPAIASQTAVVRARAVDFNGNVGEWSEPLSFDVIVGRRPPGCSQAPAPSGAAPWGVAGLLLVALVLSRRPRRAI